jgi:hypothetical protein
MTANTVYDIFLALPEMKRQHHIELVNEYKRKEDNEYAIIQQKKKKEFSYTRQNAFDYLLKIFFVQKNSLKLIAPLPSFQFLKCTWLYL